MVRLRPNVVVLSHSHWDHCNLQTLTLLDRGTAVVVPHVRKPTAFNPPIVPALRTLGFRDIREVEMWSPVRVADIEIVPVPFFGEQDEPGAEIDHFTYVIRTDGLCIYGGVDTFRDSFGEMGPVLDEVRERCLPDLAFLPVSKMIYEYRHGGVNGFCRTITPELLDKRFQYTASPEDAASWAARLGVRWAVPYAAFCIDRWEPFPAFGDVVGAFDRAGLSRVLLPMRPLDAISVHELDGGLGIAARRAFATAYYGSPAMMAAAKLARRIARRLARMRRA
jgi:L-ascorbate metabolism protein UlaG (beta-lactamase superfamily)